MMSRAIKLRDFRIGIYEGHSDHGQENCRSVSMLHEAFKIWTAGTDVGSEERCGLTIE